ncbi:MAG: sigma-70 family RNA polymerase sigma factor, partial [Victivallaceae bacterium]
SLVGQLCPREREVLQMRFGLDGHQVMTLEEVGEAVGCTRERVRQIQNKAIKKLYSMHAAPTQGGMKFNDDDDEEE